MSLLKQLFGKNAPTAASIAAEIEKASTELANVRTKVNSALAGLETMSDAEHVVAEALRAEKKRAEARLIARIDVLTADRERVLAAEAEAAKLAAEAQYAARVEAARNAVANDEPKLLAEYQKAAARVAAALAALDTLRNEVDAVNATLRQRGQEIIASIDATYRKEPDRITPDMVEKRICWIRTDENGGEHVQIAPTDDRGNPVPPAVMSDAETGRAVTAPGHFEEREVVVRQGRTRPGAYLPSLSHAVVLPPAFVGDRPIWPQE